MNFKDYYLAIPVSERSAFALRCGTKRGQLDQIAFGFRTPSAILAVAIEQESKGAVTRPELCPNDWQRIWPELTPNPEQAA